MRCDSPLAQIAYACARKTLVLRLAYALTLDLTKRAGVQFFPHELFAAKTYNAMQAKRTTANVFDAVTACFSSCREGESWIKVVPHAKG